MEYKYSTCLPLEDLLTKQILTLEELVTLSHKDTETLHADIGRGLLQVKGCVGDFYQVEAQDLERYISRSLWGQR